jgi:hypothetical protein
LDFGMGADDADGADGSAPGFSGVERVWIVVMLMVRVRARPSRPKPISQPADGRIDVRWIVRDKPMSEDEWRRTYVDK